MKRKFKFMVFLLCVAAGMQLSPVCAQDVIVTVSPTRNPLPPQALNYFENPGRYFTVSLQNTSSETLNLYLGVEIEQLEPSDGVGLTTPIDIMPPAGIVLPPNMTTPRVLTQLDLKNLFKHLSTKDITLSGPTFADYQSGAVGLLPEGHYRGKVTAYRLEYGSRNPQVLSNPITGQCYFDICYTAAAPVITEPSEFSTSLSKASGANKEKDYVTAAYSAFGQNDETLQAYTLPKDHPMVIWTAPILSCSSTRMQYLYDFNLYKLTPGQSPEDARRGGILVYSRRSLMGPQCIIPSTAIPTLLSHKSYFVAEVVAKPLITSQSSDLYSTVENDGRSPLVVMRLGESMSNNIPVMPLEEEPAVEEPKDENKEKVVKYNINPPAITKPKDDGSVWAQQIYKENEDSIIVNWDKPTIIDGPDGWNGTDTLKYTYNIKAVEVKTGMSMDSILVAKGFQEERKRTELADTIHFKNIKKLTPGSVIAIVVTANCTNEKEVKFADTGDNVVKISYLQLTSDEFAPCHPEYADNIKNHELGIFNEKELRKMEVQCGQFPLVLTKAILVDKKYYKGEGYVIWKPWGTTEIKIAVEFDSLYINTHKEVYKNGVRNMKEPVMQDIVPYNLFDKLGAGSFVDKNLKQYGPIISTYLQDDSEIGQYYKYIQDGSRVIDRLCGGESGPVYLPLSLPKEIPSCPIDIQILNCEFSATTAWMNFFGMFKLPESDYTNTKIAAFGLPHQCIGPESFIEDGDSITLSLLSDISIVIPDDSLEFKLKSPSDLSKMDDGCYISVGKDTKGEWGFKGCMLDLEMSMVDLLKDNGKGDVVKGEKPCARGQVYFHDWSDWIAKFSMDPFQTEDAPGWSFVVGGAGGITYDHSIIHNPSGFKFPQGYDKKNDKVSSELAKGDNYWQGFYMDKMQVRFPKVFEVEGSEGNEDEVPSPGSAKPAYGRVAIGVEQLMIDDSGFGFTFAGENLLSAHTPKVGGWGITLDKASLSIVQNSFNNVKINGTFEVPLFKDDKGKKENFAYDFTMANADHGKDLKYIFNVTPKDKANLDCWLATVSLYKEKTHFGVEATSDKTEVELVLGGDITINGTKDKSVLGFKIPGVHFYGMRMANFKAKEEKGQGGGAGPENKASGKGGAAAESKNSEGEVLYTYVNDDETFFFTTGAWSLSSPEKNVAGFDFNLKDFKLKTEGKDMGLAIMGEMSFVGGQLTAAAGLTVWAEVETKDFDVSYKETTFDGVKIHSEFGGVVVDGGLDVMKEDDMHGYKGTLGFKIPGDLFSFNAEGMFVEKTMSAQEAADAGMTQDEDGNYPTYNAAYFEGSVGGSVPLGAVNLTGINGGFYFNTCITAPSSHGEGITKVEDLEKKPKYGVYGGRFGLGMSDPSGAIEGSFDMTVTYDAVKDELSTFLLQGKVTGLKGIIDADATIRYTSTWSDVLERDFKLTISADVKADGPEAFEKFTGVKLEVPEVYSDLKKMQDKSNEKSDESKGKSESDLEQDAQKNGDNALKVSCGLSISLELDIYDKYSIKKNEEGKLVKDKLLKNRWHVYVGEPAQEKRCRFTIIDFQVGGKDDPVAVWAKQYANGYLCFGNELPDNGALPEIPSELKTFLSGAKDANGNANDITGKLTDRQAAFKQFNPDQQTNSAEIKGGVMFGAEIGGEFGINALICYARAKALAGFDLILKKFSEGAKCTNGTTMGGANGWYATGQVYAYITGELGLMIDLWIFKGKIPLIDAGLGALLQGGFPNPSWFHGQARAKCSLLGGLIKFNSSLEIKAGNVCVPEFGNPLDDIKLIDDITVGSFEKETGWNENNAVSCYTTPAFTTSMVIGRELRLIDEASRYEMANWDEDPSEYDENAKRSYYFFLDPTATLKVYDKNPVKDNQVPIKTANLDYTTTNNTAYGLLTGARLEQNHFYEISIGGYCKELRYNKTTHKSEYLNPVFKDEKSNYEEEERPWRQDTTFYFYTDKYPADLNEDIVLTEPSSNAVAYKVELDQPKLHMVGDRSDDINNADYVYTATLQVYDNRVGWVDPELTVAPTYVYDNEVNAYVSVDEKGNADRTSGAIYDKWGNVIDQVDWEYKELLDEYKKVVSEINQQLNDQHLYNTFAPYSWKELCQASYERTMNFRLDEGDALSNSRPGSQLNADALVMNTSYTICSPEGYKTDISIVKDNLSLDLRNVPENQTIEQMRELNPASNFLGSNLLSVLEDVYKKAQNYKGSSFVDPFANQFNLTTVSGLCESMQCLLCLIRTCYSPDKVTGGQDVRSLPAAYQLALTPEFRALNRFALPLTVNKQTDAKLEQLIKKGHTIMDERGEKYSDDIMAYKSLCEEKCIDYANPPITSYKLSLSQPSEMHEMFTTGSSSSSSTVADLEKTKVYTGSSSDSETTTDGRRMVEVDLSRESRAESSNQSELSAYFEKVNAVLSNAISEKMTSLVAANPSMTTRQKASMESLLRSTYELGTPSSLDDLFSKASTLYGSIYTDSDISYTVKKSLYDVLKDLASKAGVSSSNLKEPAAPVVRTRSTTQGTTTTTTVLKRTNLTSAVDESTPSEHLTLWYACNNMDDYCGPRASSEEPYLPTEPSTPHTSTPIVVGDLSAKTSANAVKTAAASLNTGSSFQQLQINTAQTSLSTGNTIDKLAGNLDELPMSTGSTNLLDGTFGDSKANLQLGSLMEGRSVNNINLDGSNTSGYIGDFSRVEGKEKAEDALNDKEISSSTVSINKNSFSSGSWVGNDLPEYAETGVFFNYAKQWETTKDEGTQYGYNPPRSADSTPKYEGMPVKESINGKEMTDKNDFYYWYVDKDLSSFNFDQSKTYRLVFTRTDKTKLEDMLKNLEESYKTMQANTLVSADDGYGDGTFDPNAPIDSTNINALMQKYYNDVMIELGGDSVEVLQRKFKEAKASTQYQVDVFTINNFKVSSTHDFAHDSGKILTGLYGTVLDNIGYIYPNNILDRDLAGNANVANYNNLLYNKAFDYSGIGEGIRLDVLQNDPYYRLSWLLCHFFDGGRQLKGGNYCDDHGYSPAAAPTVSLLSCSSERLSTQGNGIFWGGNSSVGNSTKMAELRAQLMPTKTHQVNPNHSYSTAHQVRQPEDGFYSIGELAGFPGRVQFKDEYGDWGINTDKLLCNQLITWVKNDLRIFVDDCGHDLDTWNTMMGSHGTRKWISDSFNTYESYRMSRMGGNGTTFEYELYHIPIIYGRTTMNRDDDALKDDKWRSGYMGKVAYEVFMKLANSDRCYSKLKTTLVRYNGFHCKTGSNNDVNGLFGYDVRPGTESTNTRHFSHQLGSDKYDEE